MAAIISSDESAPDRFQISTDEKSEIILKKCFLCKSSRKTFYCAKCLKIGDFVHQDGLPEKFSEKQSRYRQQKELNRKLEQNLEHLLVKKKLSENYRFKIKQKRQNIKILNDLIKQTKENNAKDSKSRENLEEYNREMRIKLPIYGKKVYKLEEWVNNAQDDIVRRKERYTEDEKLLKSQVRLSIQQLIQFVFPITSVMQSRSLDCHHQSQAMSEIAEATRTAYERGRWVQLQEDSLKFAIVAPTLPANGDYRAYHDWVVTNNRNAGTQPGSNELISYQNAGYRISAALSFTAQLVQILSFYLNVRLPFKMTTYGDYFTSDMKEQNFTRRVAKLNANILYLCYTQKIKLKTLKPNQTLHNLQTLLNTPEMCVDTAVDINCLADSVDSILMQDLETGDDSDLDEENIPNEWENVTNSSSMEHHHMHMQTVAVGMVANQQQSTLMTSAAASLASFWRGWTTGK